MRDLAEGQACVCCGSKDGTVVAAHYTGFRQHSFGKGKSTKGHDLCVAYLCSRCHATFDSLDASDFKDKWMKKIDQSEEFMFLILRTLMMLHKQGRLKIE